MDQSDAGQGNKRYGDWREIPDNEHENAKEPPFDLPTIQEFIPDIFPAEDPACKNCNQQGTQWKCYIGRDVIK